MITLQCQPFSITSLGCFLIISPTYIIGADSVPIPSGPGGDFFCRVIYSQYMVFYLGIVSVYNVALLALERWFAVARPTKYKTSFTKRRVYISIVFIWLWSVLLNLPHPMEIRQITTESGESQCQWFTLISSKTGREAVAFFEFILKFIMPLVLSLIIFYSLRYHAKTSKVLSQGNHGKTGRRLLRMTMATALAVAVCWLPNQVYYLLFKFDITRLDTPLHHFTVVMCMLNSAINPWIYCLTNKSYRRRFAKLLLPWRKSDDEVTRSESQVLSVSSRYKIEKISSESRSCFGTESTGIELSSMASNRDSGLSRDDQETKEFSSHSNAPHSHVTNLLNYVTRKSHQYKLTLPWKQSADITAEGKETRSNETRSSSLTMKNPGFEQSNEPVTRNNDDKTL